MDNTYEKDNKNKSEKNRSYITGLLVIILLFICCIPAFREIKIGNEVIKDGEPFSSLENTKENNVKQAKTNAKKYIKNKYGFIPKIEEVFINKEDYGISRKTGYAYVKAKHKNKNFNIVIPSDRESVNGVDNYQYEQIEKEIIKMVTNEIGKPYSYEINYISFIHDKLGNVRNGNTDANCIQEYYDGSNIIEIINNNDFNISLDYLQDVDLKKLENVNSNSIFNMDMNIVIGKYKSKEAYEWVKENNIKLYSGSISWEDGVVYSEENLVAVAMYLDEGFLNTNSNSENKIDNKYYKFDMIEYDGVYFYAANIENIKIEKIDNINWDTLAEKNGITATKYRIKDDYSISGIEGKSYVFCPTYDYEFAWLFYLDNQKQFERSNDLKTSQYFPFLINLKQGTNRIAIFGY